MFVVVTSHITTDIVYCSHNPVFLYFFITYNQIVLEKTNVYNLSYFFITYNQIVLEKTNVNNLSGEPELYQFLFRFRVTHSLIFCVVSCRTVCSFCPLSFGHWIVCHSLLQFTASDYPFGISIFFLAQDHLNKVDEIFSRTTELFNHRGGV